MHRRRAIDRLLSTGMSLRAERRLREHLAACGGCRAYYDEQVLLMRALASNLAEPTADELRRMQARALAAAAVEPATPSRTPADRLEDLLPRSRRLFALGGAAAAAAVLLVSANLLFSEPPVIGQLASSRQVTIDGRQASEGDAVREGQRVAAAERGITRIALQRGGSLRVFPGASLAVHDGGNRVELQGGRLWCLVDRGQGSFEVRTEEGTARVLGTSFVVERRGQETDVRVVEGVVEVEDAGSKGHVRVKARQRTRVRAGEAPAAAKAYAPTRDERDWWSLLAEIIERLKKDVKEGIEALQEALDSGTGK